MASDKLQIIPLGGLGEFGMNCLALRYADDILVIDAGLMFPEEELLGVDIEVSFCPHDPAPIKCWCRKPMPGLGVAFIEKYQLDRAQTLMVGDLTTDRTFAARAGLRFVNEADFFHQMEYPGAAKPVPVLQEPVKLSRTPLTIRRRAPKLGEHTDQILRELGYETAVIDKLRADRVV